MSTKLNPRPWRLTKRERIEVEAALLKLRHRLALDIETAMDHVEDGTQALGWIMEVEDWPTERGRVYPPRRTVRLFRARVALALRAALRADEEARFEEVLTDCRQRATRLRRRDDLPTGTDALHAFADGAEAGTRVAVSMLREWPPSPFWRVPIALWEWAPSWTVPPALGEHAPRDHGCACGARFLPGVDGAARDQCAGCAAGKVATYRCSRHHCQLQRVGSWPELERAGWELFCEIGRDFRHPAVCPTCARD